MSAYSDLIVADGPSWYATLNDSAGPVTPLVGTTTLANTGSPTYNEPAPGPLGKSIRFPGTGTDYVQAAAGANAAFDLGDGPFTIEFWYKFFAIAAAPSLIGKGSGNYLVRLLSALHWDLRRSGGPDVFVTTASFTDTTSWHHLVMTRVAATQPIIYVDNVSQAGTYTAGTFANTTTGFALGIDAVTPTSNMFNGWLSNVALYTKVLTPTQVAAHFAAGSSVSAIADLPPRFFRPYKAPTRFFYTRPISPVLAIADQTIDFTSSGIQDSETVGSAGVTPGDITVSPVGIASNAISGYPALTTGSVTVSPVGVVSSEVSGNSSLAQSVSAFGIADTEAVGTASLTQTVTTTGIVSNQTVGNLALSTTVTVSPIGVQDVESVGNVSVTVVVAVNIVGIADSEAVGAASLSQTISPTGIETNQTVGSSVLSVTVSPVGVQDVESIGNVSLTVVVAVNTIGITTSESIGNSVVSPGSVTVSAVGIQDSEAVGSVALTQNIAPIGIIADPAIGNSALSVAVSPTAVVSSESLGNITLTPISTASPTGVADSEAVGNVSVLIAQSVNVVGIASGSVIGNSAFTPGTVTISLVGLPTSETVGLANLGLSLSLSGINTNESVGNISLTVTPAGIGPSSIVSDGGVGNPTITTGSVTVSSVGIRSNESIGNVTASVGASVISPSGIVGTEVIGNTLITTGPVTVSTFGIASGVVVGNPFASAIQTVSAYGIFGPTPSIGNITIQIVTVFPSYEPGIIESKWNVFGLESKYEVSRPEYVWTAAGIGE